MKGRILIADDEEIVIRSCLRILAADDYEVDTARDGLDALKKVHENGFDVLILDIKMPKMGGIELLKKVKQEYPDTVGSAACLLFSADFFIGHLVGRHDDSKLHF